MLTKIKLWLITATTLTFLSLGAYARYQNRRADRAEKQGDQFKRLTNNAIHKQHKVNEAYGLDAADIDERLRPYYRDR